MLWFHLRAYDTLNVDYLGHNDDMKEVYEASGFEYHIALSRMTRFCNDGTDGELEYGEYAKNEDAEEIRDILEQSMDIMADQVPGVSEIKDYIVEKKVIVIRDEENGSIISCILWTRLGKGMEWKYWALNPAYKGTMHSINLLDDFLRVNGGVKRSTLFVRDRNPASAIYQKIGFRYDGLKDYVYCFRRERA
ncbi:MAG: GNAT family N-acetyltransferase [Lachnospiraceae bacterium]|nr:GNAT family N-acetyltransferase [Lachnospiraceae bacterium]